MSASSAKGAQSHLLHWRGGRRGGEWSDERSAADGVDELLLKRRVADAGDVHLAGTMPT